MPETPRSTNLGVRAAHMRNRSDQSTEWNSAAAWELIAALYSIASELALANEERRDV